MRMYCAYFKSRLEAMNGPDRAQILLRYPLAFYGTEFLPFALRPKGVVISVKQVISSLPAFSEYAAICEQPPEMGIPAFLLNNEFRAWGHQFIYDESTLVRLLSEAGFSDITRYPIGQSDDPALIGLETRDFNPRLKRINSAFTMVLQARKI
jgi:hypothetical protein